MPDVQKHDSTAYDDATSMSVRDDADNYTHVVYDNDTGDIRHMDSKIGGRDYDWGYGDSDQGWSDSGGGVCYIATATTMGDPNALNVLEALRGWRRNVLEQNPLGLMLSNYYRRTAPSLAERLPRHPIVAGSIRRLFVIPASRILKMEQRTKVGQAVQNFVLGTIFVSGLVYGRVLRRVVK